MAEDGMLDELKQTSLEMSAPAQSLDDRLKALINRAPVMLFMKGDPTTPRCGFSATTIEILQKNEVEFPDHILNVLETLLPTALNLNRHTNIRSSSTHLIFLRMKK